MTTILPLPLAAQHVTSLVSASRTILRLLSAKKLVSLPLRCRFHVANYPHGKKKKRRKYIIKQIWPMNASQIPQELFSPNLIKCFGFPFIILFFFWLNLGGSYAHADFTCYYKFTTVVIGNFDEAERGMRWRRIFNPESFQMDYAETGLPNAGSWAEKLQSTEY